MSLVLVSYTVSHIFKNEYLLAEFGICNFKFIFFSAYYNQPEFPEISVADPDLDPGEGRGLFGQLAFLPSVIFFFFTKNRRAPPIPFH